MAYKVPNSYVKFVRTVSPVGSSPSTRILGLIGTGNNFYEVYNEPIRRNKEGVYDSLFNNDVLEVKSITSKQVFGDKVASDVLAYKEGKDFILKDSKNIIWPTKVEPTIEIIAGSVEIGGEIKDCETLKSRIILEYDEPNKYLAEKAKYKISVVDLEGDGIYQIDKINDDGTAVFLYAGSPSPAPNYTIPGMSLIIRDLSGGQTFSEPITDEAVVENVLVDGGGTSINIGDYVDVVSTPASTQIDADCKLFPLIADADYPQFAEDPQMLDKLKQSSNLIHSALVATVMDESLVKDDEYVIEVLDAGENRETKYKITSTKGGAVISESIYESQFNKKVIPGLYMYFSKKIPGQSLTIGAKVRIVTEARQKDNCPTPGAVYYVTYTYKKPEHQYDPQVFSDYDEIVKMYGNYDFTPDGRVINTLALGAEIAFQNGASPIVCVQSASNNYVDMKEALERMEKLIPGLENVNIIVPLSEDINVANELRLHVDKMSSFDEGKERMGYIGAGMHQLVENPYAMSDDEIGMVETAKRLDNERLVFVTPGKIIKEVRDLKNGKFISRMLPGCYAAVACAALAIKNDPAEPLTNKPIYGFKSLSEVYGEKSKNKLAEAGCLVLHQDYDMIKIRHGITTHQSTLDYSGKTSIDDINSQEITLIQIKDYVAQNARIITARKYVGVKNKASIVSDVTDTIETMLKNFMQLDIIMGYDGLVVKRNPEDPRQIDVRFDIEAVYPLNYININFGFMSV